MKNCINHPERKAISISLFQKNFFFVLAAFMVMNSTLCLAQSISKINTVEEFVINITAANNPKDIVEVKFAYAFSDSTNYPELKFKMIKTPYVKTYSVKSFEGLIQSANKNIEITVSVGILVNGVLGTNSMATGRIIRVFRDPKSYGATTF